MSSISAIRSVALCLRGFELDPKKIKAMVGVAASESGISGEPIRPG